MSLFFFFFFACHSVYTDLCSHRFERKSRCFEILSHQFELRLIGREVVSSFPESRSPFRLQKLTSPEAPHFKRVALSEIGFPFGIPIRLPFTGNPRCKNDDIRSVFFLYLLFFLFAAVVPVPSFPQARHRTRRRTNLVESFSSLPSVKLRSRGDRLRSNFVLENCTSRQKKCIYPKFLKTCSWFAEPYFRPELLEKNMRIERMVVLE